MIINNFYSLVLQTETFALTIPQLCYFSSAIFIVPGRFFLYLIKCEYFCRRFTGGIFNYRQDESTNINKREGKKKGCFISRFPYFTAYHGRIWIFGTDLWHLYAWVGLQLSVPYAARHYRLCRQCWVLAGQHAAGQLPSPTNPPDGIDGECTTSVYGLSMLEKYKGLGWKKFFLIFGMSG